MHLSELKPRLSAASSQLRDELVAAALAKPEAWRSEMARNYLKEYSCYLHEGDLWVDGDLVIDIQLLVTGNLIVSGACSDTYDGMLLVLGNMYCAHMVSKMGGCVWGDLNCGGLCYQHYNDHCLEVQGTLSTRAFISHDKSVGATVWKADALDNSHSYGLSGWTEPYRLLGVEPPNADEDEEEDEEGEPGDTGDEAALPEFPQYDDCLDMLLERRAEGRDAFTVPLPPMAELEARWGKEWAWRKRLWYPGPPADSLSAGERAEIAEAGPDLLYELITSKHLPVEEFVSLASHPEPRIRWALASSPACPEACLQALATDADALVRAAVAGNAHCPPAVRPGLIADDDWRVRVAVLCGSNTAPCRETDNAVAERLAADPEPRVRRVVAAMPQLSRHLVAQLARDPDNRVSERILRFQPLDASVYEKQAGDPNANVRLAAAAHAFAGKPPFDLAEHRETRNRILQRLMLDSDVHVRDQAANGWQPYAWYEENAQRLAADTLPSIRRLWAGITRNPQILAQLAQDSAPDVRRVVAENPNTPAGTLIAMCHDVKISPLPISDEAREALNLATALSNNPRLPAEAIGILIDKENEYVRLFEDQPNLSPEQMIGRLEFERDDADADAYLKCRAYFPALRIGDRVAEEAPENGKEHWSRRLIGWAILRPKWIAAPAMFLAMTGLIFRMRGAARKMLRENDNDARVLAGPDEAAIAQLFEHMLGSDVYTLQCEALKNAHCPPEILAMLVSEYLAQGEEYNSRLPYTIKEVAASPALPVEARAELIGHLKQTYDYDVCKGLARNPTMTAAEWRDLATAACNPDIRQRAERALRVWHGECVE